jgi:glutaminyl-tRNA synthetase
MSDLLSPPLPRKGQTSADLDGAGVVRPAVRAARFPPAVPVNRLRGTMNENALTLRPRDFIRARILEDLRAGRHGGRVVTRFPPEPNGYLHIGHAKAICLGFGIAQEVPGARCHLRFDDTNPETENVDYVRAIIRDVAWLGFDWGEHLYFASDYFEAMYRFAEHLVTRGLAYVDSSTEEEIREARGTVLQPGRPTRYRDRGVEENLDLLRRMRNGEFPDGAHVLRAKIDLASPNMLLRDPILYRIRHAHHYRQGDAWCIYPLYDYAHPIEDAIEGVTHSLCTLEFENNRELYDWVVHALPRAAPGEPAFVPPSAAGAAEDAALAGTGPFLIPAASRPEQTEFARLALDFTVMSKRKLLQLVQHGDVSGWDDPRMPTIAGLRRRGVTPEAIRSFCDLIGLTKANTRVDIARLEFALRDDLNRRAPRVMCVLRPLRVVLTNWPAGHVEWLDAPLWPHDVPRAGSRPLPLSDELFIERDDFHEDPPRGFFRLAPGREVRLRHGGIIRCDEVVKDTAGAVVELRCTFDPTSMPGAAGADRRVKGTLHWVSAAHALPCEVRLYDRLFRVPDPESDDAVDFRTHLNPDSLVTIPDARVEPAVADRPAETHWQFERLGYFVPDSEESRPGQLVFNRTVTLRDTWAKVRASGSASAAGKKPAAEKRPAAGGRAAAPVATSHPDRAPRLEALRGRYERELGLSPEQADVLTRDDAIAAFFDEAAAASADPVMVARWLVNEVPREAREQAGSLPIRGSALAGLVELVRTAQISSSAGREVLAELLAEGGNPLAIVDRRGLRQVSDADALAAAVDEVIAAHPAKAAEYRAGRSGLAGFFIGQVMSRTGGRANPQLLRELVERKLG